MCSADEANRAEPWWLRERLLPHLELPADLPVHFIDEKTVTATDLDAAQSRFRLPTRGVLRNLRPILTAEELDLLEEHGGGRRTGLLVLVADANAGIIELEMTSGRGTSLTGEGYMEFIADCSFTAGDVVNIWAFTHYLSPPCLVIARKPKTPTPA